MDSVKTAYIGLQYPKESKWQRIRVEGEDGTLIEFAKNVQYGIIRLANLTSHSCRRILQTLYNLALRAILAKRRLQNLHKLILDNCEFDLTCFYLLAILGVSKLCSSLYITATCKVLTTGQDVERELIDCFSREQLTAFAKAKVPTHDAAGRQITMPSFDVYFSDEACVVRDIPKVNADQTFITTPVALLEEREDGTLICVESVLFSAAFQVPTLRSINMECLHWQSPPVAEGMLRDLRKRPSNGVPLFLQDIPEKSEFIMNLIPLVNEKKIGFIPIILQPSIHGKLGEMIQQALTMLENTLYLQTLYFQATYPEALFEVLIFLRGARKFFPRLRLPVIFTLKLERKGKDKDPKYAKTLSEIDKLLSEIKKIQELLDQESLQSLAIMLYPKMFPEKVKSPLRLLTLDVAKMLRVYLFSMPITPYDFGFDWTSVPI